MEIMKHVFTLNGHAIKFSKITRMVYDASDDTIKFWLLGTGETGWLGCSSEEYKTLVSAWDDYIERTDACGDSKVSKRII